MTRLARALMLLGIGATVLGLSKFHAASVASPAYDFTGSDRFAWSIAYMGLLTVSAYGFGLPELTRTRRAIAFASVMSVSAAALGISVAQLVVGTGLLPRFVVLGTMILLVPWFWICANLSADVQALDIQRDRVVVVGSWADAAELTYELEHGAERPATIVDVVGPDELTPKGRDLQPLRRVVSEGAATVVVLDRDAQTDPVVIGQVAQLHEAGVRIRTLSLFYEEWLGKLPVAELERVSLLFDIGEVHRRRYSRQRRVLDLTLAIPFVAALAVVTPFVVLGNLVANRGPLLFRQQRVGLGGELFTIVKFRTMRSGTDSTSWTAQDDPRITPFGELLRRTHIDELPQLLNILRGDLAFVGPRPEQGQYVDELREKLPFYDLRHLVTPGLTGWAQVKYGYAGDERDALEKLQYEFYYLRHQGLGFDVRILFRTARAILGGDGR